MADSGVILAPTFDIKTIVGSTKTLGASNAVTITLAATKTFARCAAAITTDVGTSERWLYSLAVLVCVACAT